MDECKHGESEWQLNLTLFEDHPGFGSVDVRLRCQRCGAVARFLGTRVGAGGGAPTASLFGDEIRLPVAFDLPSEVWEAGGEVSAETQAAAAKRREDSERALLTKLLAKYGSEAES